MTDEELAEEWVKKFGEDNILHFGEDEIDLAPLRKESFLAGLKAGKDMAEADLATVAYMQGATQQKKKSENQLSKAIEIIKKLSDAYKYVIQFKEYADKEILTEAEQFLKED